MSRLRTAARDIALRAARLGVPHPERVGELTPNELERLFEIYEEKRREDMRRMDALAYLIGGYVLLAVHTPRAYPAAPCGYGNAAVGDEEIKAAFIALAKKGENGHDGSA